MNNHLISPLNTTENSLNSYFNICSQCEENLAYVRGMLSLPEGL